MPNPTENPKEINERKYTHHRPEQKLTSASLSRETPKPMDATENVKMRLMEYDNCVIAILCQRINLSVAVGFFVMLWTW